MFLIAITKNKITSLPSGLTANETAIASAYITVAVDWTVTDYQQEAGGFSVSGASGFPFWQADFRKNTLSILKSTLCPVPLYFYISPRGEFFCSSHISVLRAVGVPIEENTEVLPEFFVYRYVMPPHTLFKDIQQIPNGGSLFISCHNGECKFDALTEYNPPKIDVRQNNWEAVVKKSIELLSSSLQSLEKDKTAALLSGGIDSSITFQLAHKNIGLTESYSTEYPFEDPQLNTERHYALSAAQAMGSKHHLFETTTDQYLVGLLETLMLVEEPVHHLQSVSLHLLYQQGMPRNNTVVVHGLGAGGGFGNFRNFLYWQDKPASMFFQTSWSRALLRKLSQITGKGKHFTDCMDKIQSDHVLSSPHNLLWAHHAYGSKRWVERKFNTTEEKIIERRYETVDRRSFDTLYNLWALYSLLGDEAATLSIWGKIAEGNNKVLFCPFYSLDLLNYVFSIPWPLKMSAPENRLRKDIARSVGIPEMIIDRPKSGFGVMQKHWADCDGPLEPLLALAGKVVPIEEIRAMQTSLPHDQMIFWNLINYALWKRLIINQEPLENLKSELKAARHV